MSTGTISCTILSCSFLFLGIIFAIFKGKMAKFISGFSTKTKEQRLLYDEDGLCKDQKDALFLWAFVLAIGAISSHFVSEQLAYVAIVIWLVLFFKDVHLDDEKAFGKYRKIKK